MDFIRYYSISEHVPLLESLLTLETYSMIVQYMTGYNPAFYAYVTDLC